MERQAGRFPSKTYWTLQLAGYGTGLAMCFLSLRKSLVQLLTYFAFCPVSATRASTRSIYGIGVRPIGQRVHDTRREERNVSCTRSKALPNLHLISTSGCCFFKMAAPTKTLVAVLLVLCVIQAHFKGEKRDVFGACLRSIPFIAQP